MKTPFNNSIISGTKVVMLPRWGLGFVGDVAGYKHAAPLALSPRILQPELARRVTSVKTMRMVQFAPPAELDVIFATFRAGRGKL